MFDFFFFHSRHARYFFSDLRPPPHEKSNGPSLRRADYPITWKYKREYFLWSPKYIAQVFRLRCTLPSIVRHTLAHLFLKFGVVRILAFYIWQLDWFYTSWKSLEGKTWSFVWMLMYIFCAECPYKNAFRFIFWGIATFLYAGMDYLFDSVLFSTKNATRAMPIVHIHLSEYYKT
jgi:hypothetical protein